MNALAKAVAQHLTGGRQVECEETSVLAGLDAVLGGDEPIAPIVVKLADAVGGRAAATWKWTMGTGNFLDFPESQSLIGGTQGVGTGFRARRSRAALASLVGDSWGYLAADTILLPKLLKDAGYRTGIVGKPRARLAEPAE